MLLREELELIVPEGVGVDRATLDKFSEDASVFRVEPVAVVVPRDSHDLKSLVRYVADKNKESTKEVDGSLYTLGRGHMSLTARAAGSDMSGGPLTESIAVDFMAHFQGVVSVEKERMEATVKPGTYYRDFRRGVEEPNDLLLPCYTASWRINTIGGMVANNSGGEKTLAYGQTRDYVKALKVVLSDGNEYEFRKYSKEEVAVKIQQNDFEGELYRGTRKLLEENYELIQGAKPNVSKNSAGYALWNVYDKESGSIDLTQLITGSQGTLGLVTEVTLKLVKPKHHSALLVIFLRDLNPLGKLVNRVLEHKPESFESYDNNTMKFAVRYMLDFIKLVGFWHFISLGIKFIPEVLMALTGGMPKIVLVAEFTGDSEDEIYAKAKRAEADLAEFKGDYKVKTRIARNDTEEEKYWTIRRQSFALLRKHSHGKHTAPFIDDIIVRPDVLPEFLPRLSAIMADYDLTYTIAGHIGNANFHIIPLMDYKRPDFKRIIDKLSREVYDLVLEYDGSITGEHNDGLIRTPFLTRMYGKEMTDIFRKVKLLFDPLNIFNPGKKIPLEGAVKSYAFEHIKSE